MYFYVSVLYLYTVSVNQALCSMLADATGPLLLILLNILQCVHRYTAIRLVCLPLFCVLLH